MTSSRLWSIGYWLDGLVQGYQLHACLIWIVMRKFGQSRSFCQSKIAPFTEKLITVNIWLIGSQQEWTVAQASYILSFKILFAYDIEIMVLI